jgi:hypothetical protein
MPLGEHSVQVIWFNLLFVGNHNHELATGDESVLSSKKRVCSTVYDTAKIEILSGVFDSI